MMIMKLILLAGLVVVEILLIRYYFEQRKSIKDLRFILGCLKGRSK